jgi:lipopolysaccharide export system protein LptA
MNQVLSRLLIIAAVVVPSGAALALSTDSGQPIDIEADRAEADNARRVTIYRGDVIITQGTLKLTGETVTIYYNEENQLTKLVSVGKPARFRQLPDGQPDIPKNYQNAHAKRMEYYARKDLIVLLGNAVYDQGGDRVAAERIVYDSKNSRMQAESRTASKSTGGEEKKQRSRVRIKIEPKKSN